MEIGHSNVNWSEQKHAQKLKWITVAKFPLYLIKAVISLLINLPVMSTVWRERRELERFTINHMQDIGVDPLQLKRESKRSFFDIPAERRISELTIRLKTEPVEWG